MKISTAKKYYDIVPYPRIIERKDGSITVECEDYPSCDSCKVRFKCFTQATEIVKVE